MAETESDGLVKIVEGFLAEKEAIAAKERKLIEDLNRVLGKLGYRVVPAKAASGATEAGKKRGRPPGSGKDAAPKAAAAS
jgi:hypothetical protein